MGLAPGVQTAATAAAPALTRYSIPLPRPNSGGAVLTFSVVGALSPPLTACLASGASIRAGKLQTRTALLRTREVIVLKFRFCLS